MDQIGQQSGQPEVRDVSRQTMVVLVILAIVVSLLGTFTVLRETTGAQRFVSEEVVGSQSAQGMVSLTIAGDAPSAPKDSATGYVAFTIVDN